MVPRLKSSQVREGAKALQPLALVALVGIVGTVTLLGGCGGGTQFNTTPTPAPSQPPVVTPPTPTGSTGPTPTPSGPASPIPSGSTTPTPTPTATPTATPTPSPTPTPIPQSLKLAAELTRVGGLTGAVVTSVALAPDDRWLLAYDDTPADTADASKTSLPSDAPVSLANKLAEIRANGGKIRASALGTGNTWLVIFNDDSTSYTQFEANEINPGMFNRLTSLFNARNVNVTSVAIGADSSVWAITVNQNGYYSNGIPAGLGTRLNTLSSSSSVTLNHVVLGVNNSWAVIYNNNQISQEGIDSSLFTFVDNATGTIKSGNFPVNAIALGQATTSYALVYNGNVPYLGTLTRSR